LKIRAPRLSAVDSYAPAFTLVEMVISASIMSIILVAAYLCLQSGFLGQKLVDSRTEVVQTARVALTMMGADLRSACPLSPKIPFVGMQRELGEMQADNLDFATHNFAPRRPGEADWCEVSYFIGRSADGEGFSLWRRRDPTIDDDPFAGGSREEIARGLRGLKLEYYDGLDWFDTWGDPDGKGRAENSFRERPNLEGMPEAVRITLSLGPAGDVRARDKTNAEPALVFQTVCRLNLAGVSASSGLTGGAKASDDADQSPPNSAGGTP
jgi:prepilin-type N-terminal cleavage/methylation domain-containing protein